MKHTTSRRERDRNRQIREYYANKAAKMVYLDQKHGREPRISPWAKRVTVMPPRRQT